MLDRPALTVAVVATTRLIAAVAIARLLGLLGRLGGVALRLADEGDGVLAAVPRVRRDNGHGDLLAGVDVAGLVELKAHGVVLAVRGSPIHLAARADLLAADGDRGGLLPGLPRGFPVGVGLVAADIDGDDLAGLVRGGGDRHALRASPPAGEAKVLGRVRCGGDLRLLVAARGGGARGGGPGQESLDHGGREDEHRDKRQNASKYERPCAPPRRPVCPHPQSLSRRAERCLSTG